MKSLFLLLAVLIFETLSAQNNPSDLLPSGTEYFEESAPWGGEILYVYDVSILEEIDGISFREIRFTEYSNIIVYDKGNYLVRWVRPNEYANEYAEDKREFIQIFEK
tara:strand:+ start:2585 stop:2905 length:321 start_codon:yes stop_codon:yes gene_type:complete